MEHKFICFEYKMPISTEVKKVSACKNCGTIEVINADKIEKNCSGKMHKNSSVKQLNMKPLKNK